MPCFLGALSLKGGGLLPGSLLFRASGFCFCGKATLVGLARLTLRLLSCAFFRHAPCFGIGGFLCGFRFGCTSGGFCLRRQAALFRFPCLATFFRLTGQALRFLSLCFLPLCLKPCSFFSLTPFLGDTACLCLGGFPGRFGLGGEPALFGFTRQASFFQFPSLTNRFLALGFLSLRLLACAFLGLTSFFGDATRVRFCSFFGDLGFGGSPRDFRFGREPTLFGFTRLAQQILPLPFELFLFGAGCFAARKFLPFGFLAQQLLSCLQFGDAARLGFGSESLCLCFGGESPLFGFLGQSALFYFTRLSRGFLTLLFAGCFGGSQFGSFLLCLLAFERSLLATFLFGRLARFCLRIRLGRLALVNFWRRWHLGTQFWRGGCGVGRSWSRCGFWRHR